MKFSYLETPQKQYEDVILVSPKAPIFGDLKMIRRKSCDCSDCGKVGQKMKRLMASYTPRENDKNDEKNKPDLAVKVDIAERIITKCQTPLSSSRNASINKARGLRACVQSQRLLIYDIKKKLSIVKQQFNGYLPLGINFKKFGPSMYSVPYKHYHTNQIDEQQSTSAVSDVNTDVGKEQPQVAHSPTFQQLSKDSNHLRQYILRKSSKTIHTYVQAKNNETCSKENINILQQTTTTMMTSQKQFRKKNIVKSSNPTPIKPVGTQSPYLADQLQHLSLYRLRSIASCHTIKRSSRKGGKSEHA